MTGNDTFSKSASSPNRTLFLKVSTPTYTPISTLLMSNKEQAFDDLQDSLTAIDYINKQEELEREARTLMPFDPNECTYELGELRQQVYACLTCSKLNDNQPIGVCYSCSIQCHSKHELVELFTKRSFLCDCGTTRMAKTPNGACNLRRADRNSVGSLSGLGSRLSSHVELPAEDIPSNSNVYNQNFHGNFCGCKQPYDPANETGNMLQCYFGYVCGEDWFHDRCIMGLQPDAQLKKQLYAVVQGTENEASHAEEISLGDDESDEEDYSGTTDKLKYFPRLKLFDEFICWQCVSKFHDIFVQLDQKIPGVIMEKLPRYTGVGSDEEWKKLKEKEDEPKVKRTKIEGEHNITDVGQYSIFLCKHFRRKLTENIPKLDHESRLYQFFQNHLYLYEEDPVYKPPEDPSEDTWSTTLSNPDMCALDVIQNLPRDQAIEGIQAYNTIKAKLRDFFKPFAEQGKIVTEDEVKSFFGEMTAKDKSN